MIDERITAFIKEHHVLTVAASSDGGLWCANCFYAYLPEEEGFVVSSDESTRHALMFARNPQVAGTIVLETEEIGKIQGLQFSAHVTKCSAALFDHYRLAYLRRFPYAALKINEVWFMHLTSLKFTDNRLGFGKKLLWNRE